MHPRCLYMSILVGFLLVSGGVLTAFLYPRDVNISIVSINSTSYDAPVSDLTGSEDSDYAFLEIEVGSLVSKYEMFHYKLSPFQTSVKIENSNFFPVSVSFMNVTLTNDQSQVGQVASKPFSVASRDSQLVSEPSTATARYIAQQ